MGRWLWLFGGGIAALAMLGGGIWMSLSPPAATPLVAAPEPSPAVSPTFTASPLVPKSPAASASAAASTSASASSSPSAAESSAPAGLPNPDGRNLALRRPATASGVQDPFIAASAVDGDAGTRWSSAFTDSQWIRVDLGSLRQVSTVRLNWETSYAVAYAVQVSPDARSWHTVYSTKAGRGGNVTLSDLNGTGRYVRVLCSKRATQYGFSLFELGVY